MTDIVLIALCFGAAMLIMHLSMTYRYNAAYDRLRDEFKSDREQWYKERQMLLDRIQAPSFAQFAHKTLEEKKMEQPKEDEEEKTEYLT